jgi:hypothetical protein
MRSGCQAEDTAGCTSSVLQMNSFDRHCLARWVRAEFTKHSPYRPSLQQQGIFVLQKRTRGVCAAPVLLLASSLPQQLWH